MAEHPFTDPEWEGWMKRKNKSGQWYASRRVGLVVMHIHLCPDGIEPLLILTNVDNYYGIFSEHIQSLELGLAAANAIAEAVGGWE